MVSLSCAAFAASAPDEKQLPLRLRLLPFHAACHAIDTNSSAPGEIGPLVVKYQEDQGEDGSDTLAAIINGLDKINTSINLVLQMKDTLIALKGALKKPVNPVKLMHAVKTTKETT